MRKVMNMRLENFVTLGTAAENVICRRNFIGRIPGTGLPALRRVGFAQANTSPSPVLGDKLDPRGFKRMSDREIIGRRQRCLTFGQFRAANSGDRESRRLREIFGAPTNQRAASSNLRAGEGAPNGN